MEGQQRGREKEAECGGGGEEGGDKPEKDNLLHNVSY